MKALSDKALRRVREFQNFETEGSRGRRMAQGGYLGNPRVIFDNGGGVTVQIWDGENSYSHHYDDPQEAAIDVAAWVEGENTYDWEGNDEDAMFDPTADELRNGSYRIWMIGDDIPSDPGWDNMIDFFEMIKSRGRKMAQGSYSPELDWSSDSYWSAEVSPKKKAGSPGKFEGIPDKYVGLAEELYGEIPDEEVGDVTDWGVWYGLYSPAEGDNFGGVILSEDSQGFVDMEVYESMDEAQAQFDMISNEIYSAEGAEDEGFEAEGSRGKKMAQGKEHQGHKNYETWVLTLWLKNDYNDYQYWRNRAMEAKAEGPESFIYTLSDELKEFYTDQAPDLQGVYADLLGFALDEIDWREVAESISQD